jgi:hypothetical protein
LGIKTKYMSDFEAAFPGSEQPTCFYRFAYICHY